MGAGAMSRGVVRLVVASPDGTRILARPNGLAGWMLPAVPAELPVRSWTDDLSARAEAALGGPVEPLRPLPPGAWVVVLGGRITAAGNTWIGVDEVARFGADATIVERWAETGGSPRRDSGRG